MPRRKRHHTGDHPPEQVVKNETDSGMAIFTCKRIVKKKLEQQKDFVLTESDPDDWSNPVSDQQFCEKSKLNELVHAIKSEPPPEPSYINLDDKNFTIEENEAKIKASNAEIPMKREPSPEPSYINLEDENFTIEENDVKSEILNAELNNTDSQPVGIQNKPEMVRTNDPDPLVVKRNQPEKEESNIKGKRKYLRKTVYCELCNKHFKTHISYKRHKIVHSDKKPFSCDICSQAFKRKDQLLSHMKSHSDSKPFSCDICSTKFKYKYNLATHMKSHSDSSPFTCNICSFKSKWKYSLASHMKTHSDDRPFICDICNVKFIWKRDLATHMMTHSDDRPFICDICSCRFNLKQSLAKHIKHHTKPFSCDICSHTFNLKKSLAKHMISHTRNKLHACPICQKCFTVKGNMKLHVHTHKINPLICPVCHEEHFSKASRNQHVRTHMPGNKGPFKCEHCPKFYSLKPNLIGHYKTDHPPKRDLHETVMRKKLEEKTHYPVVNKSSDNE